MVVWKKLSVFNHIPVVHYEPSQSEENDDDQEFEVDSQTNSSVEEVTLRPPFDQKEPERGPARNREEEEAGGDGEGREGEGEGEGGGVTRKDLVPVEWVVCSLNCAYVVLCKESS